MCTLVALDPRSALESYHSQADEEDIFHTFVEERLPEMRWFAS